jgi:hypothetical protein
LSHSDSPIPTFLKRFYLKIFINAGKLQHEILFCEHSLYMFSPWSKLVDVGSL